MEITGHAVGFSGADRFISGWTGGVVMKTKLVMKRISDVQPGDLMVGRDGWKTLDSVRTIRRVRESHKIKGKIVLEYSLDERPSVIGKIRRWPNFYVICIKK